MTSDRIVVTVFLVWCVAFSPGRLVEETAAEDKAGQTAAALVRQLGDPSFRVREQATRKLAGLGIVAEKALRVGLKSSRAEVRKRCRKILDVVLEADQRKRLAAFANDPQGKLGISLPLWSQYRKAIGRDATARALFVGMQEAEGKLFRTALDDPQRAGDLLRERAEELNERAQSGGQLISFHRVATLMFLSTLADVKTSETTLQHLQLLAFRNGFAFGVNRSSRAAAMRKLLSQWIDHHGDHDDATIAYYHVRLSQRFGIEQGVKPALKLLKLKEATPQNLASAMLTLGRFGDRSNVKTNIKSVEPLLKNEAACWTQGRIIQVRDVALAVLVHLRGEKLEDYGFAGAKAHDETLFAIDSLWFVDEANRKAALDKWAKRRD